MITVEFKNFDDMVTFARNLVRDLAGKAGSAEQPQPVQQPQYTQPPVQTSTPSYTADELSRAAITLMDAGRQNELIGLLQQFGVMSVPNLRPDQYGAFATALRGLGAQI